MKKTMSILLAILLSVSFVACGYSESMSSNASHDSVSSRNQNESDVSSEVTSESIEKTSSVQEIVTSKTQDTTSSQQTSPKIVYRTPTGKRYHYSATCGGKNSKEVSLDDAKASGLTPCQKCAK